MVLNFRNKKSGVYEFIPRGKYTMTPVIKLEEIERSVVD